MTIRDQTRDQIDHTLCHTAVPGVLNVPDGFHLIVHSLHQGALAQEPCVPEAHQTMLPVRPAFREPCEPLAQEESMPGPRNVAASPKELSAQSSGEGLDRAAIVALAWRHMQGQQFSLIVDDEMQREAVAPPWRSSPARPRPRRLWGWQSGGCHRQPVASSRCRPSPCSALCAWQDSHTRGPALVGGLRQSEQSSPSEGKRGANAPPHTPESHASRSGNASSEHKRGASGAR